MVHICHRPITYKSEWKGKDINNSRFIIICIQRVCCPLFLHGENPLIISALIIHSLYAFDCILPFIQSDVLFIFYLQFLSVCLSVYTLDCFYVVFFYVSLCPVGSYFCRSQKDAKGLKQIYAPQYQNTSIGNIILLLKETTRQGKVWKGANETALQHQLENVIPRIRDYCA